MSVTVGRARIGVVLLGLIGVVLLLIGVIALSLLPSIFKSKLQENLVLAEGKEAFEKWKTTPIPVSFSIYLFNTTNPWEVANHGARPLMQEVGPFVFKQLRSKEILGWDHENKTVTYNDLKQYHFVPSLSKNLTLKVYTLNLPLQGIVMFARKMTYFVRNLALPPLSNLLDTYNEKLFVYKSAEDLLFKGYKVDLIEDLIGLAKPFADVPEILPNNTFGFLYGKNNSGDGVFTVYTGEDDVSKYSQIVTWNNMSSVPWWNDAYCNMMNGTDGAQFPPPVTRRDVLYAYTPELCRSVFLEYDFDVHVKGIPALRFTTPPRLFATPKINPDNMCYCTEKEYCDMSGILDLSPCRDGMKLALTGPHFFRGHPFFVDRIDGLTPNTDLHDTFVDIEPNTGIVLRASRKLQMNFLVQKFSAFKQTENVDDNVIPLLWLAEEAEINDEMAALFTAKVRTPLTIAKSILTACIVLGILWIVTAGFVTVYILVKQQNTAKKVIKNQYKAVPLKPEEISKNEKYASGKEHLVA